MEKLAIKGNIILWTVGSKKWLINYDELTIAYINGKHPFTSHVLSTATLNKILAIIRRVAGDWWIPQLKKIKNYRCIPLNKLQQLRNPKEPNTKLGCGKYATVYSYNGHAVKVIGHRFYKNLPRIDGAVEAKILRQLRNKILYSYISPCIVTMYQYTASKGTDYIVLEKLPDTLWTYLQGDASDRIIKGIILQVLFTILAIKSVFPGFRHNDLKVDNILLGHAPRKQRLTLRYKSRYWALTPDIPLVKIADFDYAQIPKICKNPKVDTNYAQKFGCTAKPSAIYDQHLFLNSVYIYRHHLSPKLISWLQKQLPASVRGTENTDVTFGRLKNAEKWSGVLGTPLKTIISPFFSSFLTTHPTYPLWGVK